MAEKMGGPRPHPDDFMIVTLSFEFQAKPNPEVSDPPLFETTAVEHTFDAAEAADYLEEVVTAIRERRLYGFMLQDAAQSYFDAGEWIEQTAEEIIAEAMARERKEDGRSE